MFARPIVIAAPLLLLLLAAPAIASFSQQGPKLVGTGAVGPGLIAPDASG